MTSAECLLANRVASVRNYSRGQSSEGASSMKLWKRAKDLAVDARVEDESYHAVALREIESDVRRDGLWAKGVCVPEPQWTPFGRGSVGRRASPCFASRLSGHEPDADPRGSEEVRSIQPPGLPGEKIVTDLRLGRAPPRPPPSC
jgi:hypothetical protein